MAVAVTLLKGRRQTKQFWAPPDGERPLSELPFLRIKTEPRPKPRACAASSLQSLGSGLEECREHPSRPRLCMQESSSLTQATRKPH